MPGNPNHFWRFSAALGGPLLAQAAVFAAAGLGLGKLGPLDLILHLVVILCAGMLQGLLCVAVERRWPGLGRGRLALLPALLFSFFGILSLASLISMQTWGQQATLGMLLRSIPDLPMLSRQVGLPGWTALALSLSWLLGSWWLYRRILGRYACKDWPAGMGPALSWGLALSIAIFVAGNIGSGLHWWENDLAVGLFEGEQTSVEMTAERLQAIIRDRAALAALGPRPAGARNVVLIVVDAGRADHLGVYGYARPTTPYLSRLQAQGQIQKVDWDFASGPVTFSSLLQLNSSKPLRRASLNSFSLSDYFKHEGYQVDAFASGDLHWYGLKELYERDCDIFMDGLSEPFGAGLDDSWIPKALALLPQATARPAFIYVHLMVAHNIGILDPKYMRYLPSRNLAPWREWIARNGGPEARRAIVNNYDNRILQADAEIQGIVADLEAKGYLAHAVICVTADHGQFLGEHGDFGHQHGLLYNEGLHVPLLFWGKGLPRLKETHFACGLDLAPSLAALAGLREPGAWEGRSLLQPPQPRMTVHENINSLEDIGAVMGWDGRKIMKYLRQRKGGQLLSEELYSVEEDPKEADNLISRADPALLQRFRSEAAQDMLP